MSDTKEHFDAKNPSTSTEDDDEIVESDIELDVTDVVEPDDDPPQKVGGIKLGWDAYCNFAFSWGGCQLVPQTSRFLYCLMADGKPFS